MKLRPIILLTIFGLLITSCSFEQKASGEKYEVVVNYNDLSGRRKSNWAERNNDPDKLYLFFEVNYSDDTISIKTNLDDSTRSIMLTTDSRLSLADVAEFDKIRNIQWVEIKKNNGKTLKFDIKEKWMNKWAINYYNDTLRASVLKFAPFYD